MFCTGYAYVVTYMCEALCDNSQFQLQSGPCLPLRHVGVCNLLIKKRGIPVIYRYSYSYIASTYIHIVCIISFLQMLATNTSDIATYVTGLCMQELQCTCVAIAIYSHACYSYMVAN